MNLEVLVKPQHNGTECPSNITETEYCNNQDCPEGKSNKELFIPVDFFFLHRNKNMWILSFLVSEGALQPEVLWGTNEKEKFSAKNILANEEGFSNDTNANFWLAEKGKVEGQGFVMKVGNSRRKIVGVHFVQNSKWNWATKRFRLEGALLKEPEIVGQRGQENEPSWSPEILKKAGPWEELLDETLKKTPSLLQTFFFKNTTEIRYLWFHLVSFYGRGGGLQYFAPILQSGEPCAYLCINSFIFATIRCLRMEQLDKLRMVLRR